jgi:hypothetical protein
MCGGERAEGEYENGGDAIVVLLDEAPICRSHDVITKPSSYGSRLANMSVHEKEIIRMQCLE